MSLLQKALRDRSVEVRLAVFYGYPPLPIILSGFRDPDFSVRIAAVNAIPSLMDDAIPALRELIRLPPPPSMASLWKNTVVRQISAVYELGIPLQSLGLPLRVYLRGYLDQEKPEGDELALVRRMLRDLN